MAKTVFLDNTTAIRLKYRKKMARFVKDEARLTQRTLQRLFVRRTPRKAPKNERPELWLYEGTRKVMKMAEFLKQFKEEIRSNAEKTSGTRTIYTGSVMSSRRVGKYKAKASAHNQANQLKFAQRVARAEAKGRKTSGFKKPGDVSWVDNVFKTHLDTYTKRGSSPGQPPVTWKNVNRGKGGQGSNFPDYYLRSSIRLAQRDDLNAEVFILPYYRSNQILKILEEGGSVTRQKKILLGYRRLNYKVQKNGKEAGNQRTKFETVIQKKTIHSTIAKRPYLAPVEAEVKKNALDYFKKH